MSMRCQSGIQCSLEVCHAGEHKSTDGWSEDWEAAEFADAIRAAEAAAFAKGERSGVEAGYIRGLEAALHLYRKRGRLPVGVGFAKAMTSTIYSAERHVAAKEDPEPCKVCGLMLGEPCDHGISK